MTLGESEKLLVKNTYVLPVAGSAYLTHLKFSEYSMVVLGLVSMRVLVASNTVVLSTGWEYRCLKEGSDFRLMTKCLLVW